MALPVGHGSPYQTLVKYDLTLEKKQLQFQTRLFEDLARKFSEKNHLQFQTTQFKDITNTLEFKERQIEDFKKQFDKLIANFIHREIDYCSVDSFAGSRYG